MKALKLCTRNTMKVDESLLMIKLKLYFEQNEEKKNLKSLLESQGKVKTG